MKKSSIKRSSQKKRVPLLAFALVALLLIMLPVLVLYNQKQQEYRSNAAVLANPLAGMNLNFPFKSEQYYAAADQWQSTRPEDAALLRRLGDQQKSVWYGEDWASAATIASSVDTVMNQAAATNAVPVLVAYSIPKRDCSSYSGGGSPSIASYQNWIQQFANGINHRQAIVILEPDALTQFDCLSAQEQTDRLSLLQFAVTTLKAQGANVYIDAGNARWIAANTIATRLTQSGIAEADGFAVNVSNFFSTEESANYGNQISSQVGGKHFVIDTSRNGLGPYIYPQNGQNQWCNPPGRALGVAATTETGMETVDAFLWVKVPGESDGNCTEFGQSDPNAGAFMPEYALGLAQRASWMTITPTQGPTVTGVPTDAPTNTPVPTNTPTPTMTPTPVPPTPTFTPTPTPASTEKIKNGSFESALTNWSFVSTSPAAGSVTTTTSTKTLGNYSAQVTVTKASANKWYVQLMQNSLPLTAGRTYTVSFWAKASKSLSIDNDVQQSGGNWTVYSTKTFTLTTAWKQYTYTFTAPVSVTSQLAFNMAKTTGTIWIDNVSFK